LSNYQEHDPTTIIADIEEEIAKVTDSPTKKSQQSLPDGSLD